MGNWKEAHKKAVEKDNDENVLQPSEFWAKFPNVWEAVAGYVDDNGDVVEGMSLTVWIDGTQGKACLNDKANDKTGYMDWEIEFPLVDCLEDALSRGKIGWKEKKNFRK